MGNKYVYIISYELNLKLLRNYTPLYTAIKGFSPWMHYIDNTWFVITDCSAQEIYQQLARHIFKDDKMFVSRITTDYFGHLPKGAWEWFNNNQHHLQATGYY